MNLKDVKVIVKQCQFCRAWDIEKGCIYETAKNKFPVEDCGGFERVQISQYDYEKEKTN